MPPRAWRPGFEPAELSFRVPYFFHQARRGIRGAQILYDTHFSGNQKFVDLNGDLGGVAVGLPFVAS
jgi:hypothetical protein